MRAALLTTALFAIAAAALLGTRPLWLDEILQLIETREPSAARMLQNLPRNPGAAPIGYLTQHGMLAVTGYSVRRARLPAALFGVAAVFAVAVMGLELGLRHAWVGAAVFGFFPEVLRYATESRVYSEALFLSIVATLLYLRLAKDPVWWRAAVYWAALTAAAYTQPYAVSVGVAHVLWSVMVRERRTALFGGAALAAAGLAFLPWWLSSRARWASTVAESSLHFSASLKTPLMLFRELTGGGYWVSGLVLILCAVAVGRRRLSSRAVTLLVLMITTPLVCVFAADALGDYFVATRQFMWVLPAIAVLAGAEIESHNRCAMVCGVLLAVTCVARDWRYFSTPRENWDAAAAAIAEQTARGACLAVAPPESAAYYEFFRPSLAHAVCLSTKVVLAVTPYTTNAQRATATAVLQAEGYREEGQTTAGGSTLVLFHR